jgi:phage FluMu protein gp41
MAQIIKGTVQGKLVDGFEYRGEKQFDFEMSKVKTTGALFDAEIESNGVENTLAFNGALMAGQLNSIGTCNGPFTIEQIKALSPTDFGVLRGAQMELSAAEEESPNSQNPDKQSGD